MRLLISPTTYLLAKAAGKPGVVPMKYSQLAVVLTCLVASYLTAIRMQSQLSSHDAHSKATPTFLQLIFGTTFIEPVFEVANVSPVQKNIR